MTDQTWWYLTRTAGIIAWALLAISVFWGVALSSRFLGKQPKPNWMLDLHRFAGGLAVVFTLIHIAALMLDNYLTFTVADVIVPFASTYHPVAVAWGVVAMYLLAAVELTSLLRQHLSKRHWRALHYLSFPSFALATVHLLWVGTDRRTALLRAITLVVVAAVTCSTLIRIVMADRKETASARAG